MKQKTAPSQTNHEGETKREEVEAAPLHREWLLDEALEETFPASDPIAPATIPKADAPASSI